MFDPETTRRDSLKRFDIPRSRRGNVLISDVSICYTEFSILPRILPRAERNQQAVVSEKRFSTVTNAIQKVLRITGPWEKI
jgi:hypothetical protein